MFPWWRHKLGAFVESTRQQATILSSRARADGREFLFFRRAEGIKMKQHGQGLVQVVYALLSICLWAVLAIVPVAGLLGAFNPVRY
jgi:hypothetical protein